MEYKKSFSILPKRFPKIGHSRFILQVHECPWANPRDD